MPKRSLARVAVLGLLVMAPLHVACGAQSPTHPSSPALSIAAIAPQRGSTGGSTSAKIIGNGFVSGMSVRINDAVIPATVLNAQVIQVMMPAHAAGPVDITVAAPGGTSATLPQGYLYEIFAITSITPAAGIPDGYNVVSINGTGFSNQSKVFFDGIEAEFVSGYGSPLTNTLLPVWPPPHVAGTVDVVVINSGDQVRLSKAYTYASSDTFDFNGSWTGFAWERNTPIRFTVENSTLTSMTCGSATRTFSPAVPVIKGEFSVAGPDIKMTGRIWSPIEANGLLEMPGCLSEFGWTANK